MFRPGNPNPAACPEDRLESWKEIAVYLNRDVRTVQRWEVTKGLPVRREPGGMLARVYALKPEIDAWWNKRAIHVIDGAAGPVTAAAVGKRYPRWSWAAAVAALATATLAMAIWWLGNRIPRETSPAPIPLTSYPGHELQPSFSPDGNRVAFSWDGQGQDNFDIYVKQIGNEELVRLTTDPRRDFSPVWSPDGLSIVFCRLLAPSTTGFFVIPAMGGPERKLAEIEGGSCLTCHPLVAWSPDSRSLIIEAREPTERPVSLFLLSLATGERRRLTQAPAGSLGDVMPALSPSGRLLAFSRVLTFGASDLYLLTLSQELAPRGSPRRLTFTNQWINGPAWTPDVGEIIFASGPWFSGGYGLWRIPVTGSAFPHRLEFATELSDSPALSRQGVLTYARMMSDSNIWAGALSGPSGRLATPRRLIDSTREDLSPQFSPDGKRIAFLSNRGGTPEVWICNRDGSKSVQLTSMRAPITGGIRWSPDGKQIAFDSNQSGRFQVYLIGVSGGAPFRFTRSRADDAVPSWSHDGRWIYFGSNRTGQWQLWKMPSVGGEAVQLTRQGGTMPLESPDGKYVYYSQLGPPVAVSRVMRVPVQGGDERRVIEAAMRGNFAVTPEGIYFTSDRDRAGLHSIQFFNFASGRTSPMLTLHQRAGAGIAVSPDTQTLLYTQIDQESSDLMLVENFR